MRVLQVIAEFGSGGAERVVLMLVQDRRANGEEVGLVAAAGFLDAELPAGVARFAVPDRGRSPTGASLTARAFAGALRRYRPAVIHTHGVKVLGLTFVARMLLGSPRRPAILATHHATAPGEAATAARVFGYATHVVCVSEALRDRLLADGVPAEQVSVVHNAVAPAAVELDPATERELGIDGRPVVSLVGRLEEQKRPALFVDVAAALAARDERVRFLVVGDGSLRAATEARARERGVAHAIRFTGTRPDARALIARSSALVFTSSWEGLSIAALEALSAGVPVVATDTDGMREILRDGAGAIVADPTPEAFAGVLGALVADDARRRAMGEQGRRVIAERFSPQAMCAAYRALYARLA